NLVRRDAANYVPRDRRLLVLQLVADGVGGIRCGVLCVAERALRLSLGLTILVTGQLALGFLQLAFGLVAHRDPLSRGSTRTESSSIRERPRRARGSGARTRSSRCASAACRAGAPNALAPRSTRGRCRGRATRAASSRPRCSRTRCPG